MIHTMRSTLGAIACLAVLAPAADATVIVDYGSDGTPMAFQNHFVANGTGMADPFVTNADSVDLVANGVGNFNSIIFTSIPTTPLDLSGFRAGSFMEIDVEILPQDDSVLVNFGYELRGDDGMGDAFGQANRFNFDFSAIQGAPEDTNVPSPRVTPAPGDYTLVSTNTLGTPAPIFAGLPFISDLSTINSAELVYQSWTTEDRSGNTYAMRIKEVRLINVPEPTAAASVVLAIVCGAVRRRIG